MLTIDNLTCEYRTNPLGVDATAPRLSWKLKGDQAGLRQAAYHILAASAPALLAEGQGGPVGQRAGGVGWLGARALRRAQARFAPAGLLAGDRVGCGRG